MKRLAAALAAAAALLLGGCGTVPPAAPDPLFADARFAPPAAPVDKDALFALSAPMRAYLQNEIAPRVRQHGAQAALAAALFRRGDLRLEYDAAFTRTAAEAFDARAGNCLSLVVMTAAFARELGVQVEYRSATNFETWGRQGDLLVHSGHLNLTLGPRSLDTQNGRYWLHTLTIDFLPGEAIAGLRTRAIGEATVVAMFLNNRAAELLGEGRVDDAYWHAREALRTDPGFASAANTLGVVYLRRGLAAAAEAAFRRALEADAANPRALGNLAGALDAQGRAAEAGAVRERLARIEPHPPYHWYRLGIAAATRGDWTEARTLFERELRRADENAEFHHALGVALWNLGEHEDARREFARALQQSTTRADRARYEAKLERLREAGGPVLR